MSRLIGCVYSLAIVLAGVPAWAGDVFCDDPARVICSEKKIDDGYGTTYRGSDPAPLIAATRLQLIPRIQKKFLKAFDADASIVKRYAEWVNGPGWFGENCLGDRVTSCQRQLANAVTNRVIATFMETDEDQSQLLGFRAMHNLVHDPLFAQVQDKAVALEGRLISRPKSQELAAKIFDDLKKAYADRLASWPIADGQKKAMLDRLSKLRYIKQDGCVNAMAPLYVVNAFNEPTENTVSLCNGLFLKSNSPAALAFTIGHEIAHTFDPCTYISPTGPQPTAALNTCLDRAKTPTDGATIASCSDRDQTADVFADWAASEVVPGYLERKFPSKSKRQRRARYMAASADECDQAFHGRAHPAGRDRINKILFQNPTVRTLSGCKAEAEPSLYCPFVDAGVATPAKPASGVR